MDASLHQALHGTDVAEASIEPLRAGPLHLERQGLVLRNLRMGPHLVWSSLGFVWRDAHWGTPAPVIDAIERTSSVDSFRFTIHAHLPGPPRIDLRVEAEGDAQGCIRYRAQALPTCEVTTQRAGLCLEHPLALAGLPLRITHDDGRSSESVWPQQVPPWPPFMGVRAIAHAYAPGAWAHARLEGETFETEDQRNNADASFKTYSRSNFMPRPYRLQAGEAVNQSALLWLAAAEPSAAEVLEAARHADAGAGRVQALAPPPQWRVPPVLGVGLAPTDLTRHAQWLPLLKALGPARLHLVMDHAEQTLDRPALARVLEACDGRLRLDLRALNAPSAETVQGTERDDAIACPIRALARRLEQAGIRPQTVALFPGQAAEQARLRAAFAHAAVGAGTPYFFAQANRAERLHGADFLSFTTCSLVHGTESALVMDSLRSLPSLLATLRERHAVEAVEVGPSGIAAPRSPLGAQPPTDGRHFACLARRDPRSRALFGAAWLAGHVASLVQGGAQAISLAGLGEDDGLWIEGPQGLTPSPAWYVLRELLRPALAMQAQAWAQGPWARIDWRRAGAPGGMAPEMGCLIANLGPQELPVARALGEEAGSSQVHCLDAASWQAHTARAHDDPQAPGPWRALARNEESPPADLVLGPYALALVTRFGGKQASRLGNGQPDH